jgi:hypothetical protein
MTPEERLRRLLANPRFKPRKPSGKAYVIGGQPPPAKRKA